MNRMNEKDVLQHLGGSAESVDRALRAFTAAADVLSSDHPRLIDVYPRQWVGVHGGRVAASAETLDALLTRLRDSGIPPENAIVRFIDKNERNLIL